VAADKANDIREFVGLLRHMQVRPHVAQNWNRPGGSAIDARYHAACEICHQSEAPAANRASVWMDEIGGWNPQGETELPRCSGALFNKFLARRAEHASCRALSCLHRDQ